MRILILGGTRFLGRTVAVSLVALGHDLTLLSRRETCDLVGARLICAERSAGLAILQNNRFDLILDFICYDEQNVKQVAASVVTDCYVLISTTWLPRLWSGSEADEIPKEPVAESIGLPSVTFNYLTGKLRAEEALAGLRHHGCKAVSLRLPIILGDGDHTGRLDFYRCRLADGCPLMVVDGGYNHAQIAVMEDLAHAIVCWVTQTDIGRFRIWEGLPDDGRSVRAIIETMAAAAGVVSKVFEVPSVTLARGLPAYLEQEPFWRESALPRTKANIYAELGLTAAVFGQKINMAKPCDHKILSLRKEELKFLANRHLV